MAADLGRRNESGMALVLTLLLISFLVAVTMQLMVTADRQVTEATAQREQVRLDAMVLAGLNLARAALLADQEENNFDSMQDLWATFDPETLKTLAGDLDLRITVTDLSGRLQVNALGAKGPSRNPGGSAQQGSQDQQKIHAIWLRLLTSGKFAIEDEEQAEALLDAIGDWIDQDGNERDQGAEEPYYRSLKPPYASRNKAVTQIGELLLIKGMKQEILYGDKEHEALANYITVAGEDGKINLNSAPSLVLQALSADMTPQLAQDLIDFREDKRNTEALDSVSWYKQVGGFPEGVSFDSSLLTVAGTHFSIKVQATHNQFIRTGTGMLKRQENKGQEILLWQIQ